MMRSPLALVLVFLQLPSMFSVEPRNKIVSWTYCMTVAWLIQHLCFLQSLNKDSSISFCWGSFLFLSKPFWQMMLFVTNVNEWRHTRWHNYRTHSNVRGPKVVIALTSSVFFWPCSFSSTSSKLIRGGIIWKGIICPMHWYIKFSQGIKGIRVVGVKMGVPNCMRNWESVESWRRYWYRSGETKLTILHICST